jgi:hypothetical protein
LARTKEALRHTNRHTRSFFMDDSLRRFYWCLLRGRGGKIIPQFSRNEND